MAQAGYTPIQIYSSTTASAAPSAGNLTNSSLGAELAINITDGKLYYKDNGGVVQLLASKAGAAGDVVGPASATDNAVVRFDGTTGKLVQDSAVTIADTTGNITGGTYNKVTITAPATGSTLTIADGKTLTANNSLTLGGTDSTTMTFPATSQTIAGLAVSSQIFTTAQTFRATDAVRSEAAATQDAIVLKGRAGGTSSYAVAMTPTTLTGNRTTTFPDSDTNIPIASQIITFSGPTAARTYTFPDANTTVAGLGTTQTFTGVNTINQGIWANNPITAVANAATVPVDYKLTTVTNNSAATLTITMATAGAVDGQMVIVRIYDFSAAVQTITWVNTENSNVAVPASTNGSTTSPVTVGFMYNSAASGGPKWRCIASA